jgi:serine/threonine protein kinase
MALLLGTRLGHSEVVAPLAEGPRVAHDSERRARFEREASTISSLNHPHICTLFDWSQTFSDVWVMDTNYRVIEKRAGGGGLP